MVAKVTTHLPTVKTNCSSFIPESSYYTRYSGPLALPWNSPNFSVMAALCFGSSSLCLCGLTVGSCCQPWSCKKIFLGFFSWPRALLTFQALSNVNNSLVSSSICIIVTPASSSPHSYLLLSMDLYWRALTATRSPTHQKRRWSSCHFPLLLPSSNCFHIFHISQSHGLLPSEAS